MKKLSLTLLAALVATSISVNSAFAFDKDHSTLVFSKSQGLTQNYSSMVSSQS